MYCHYHKVMGPSPIRMTTFEENPFDHYLPLLKDAAAIQSAISEVCELMLHRRIEPKEASALFYAMQVASSNLGVALARKRPPQNAKPKSDPSLETAVANVSPTAAASQPEPNPLPPGTIQACEEPPRRRRRLRA
jgi:hypothetical protein